VVVQVVVHPLVGEVIAQVVEELTYMVKVLMVKEVLVETVVLVDVKDQM